MALRDAAITELVGQLQRINRNHQQDAARVAMWDQAVTSMRNFMADHDVDVDDPTIIRTLLVAVLAVQGAADVAYRTGHMDADSAYGAQWAAAHVMSLLAEFAPVP